MRQKQRILSKENDKMRKENREKNREKKRNLNNTEKILKKKVIYNIIRRNTVPFLQHSFRKGMNQFLLHRYMEIFSVSQVNVQFAWVKKIVKTMLFEKSLPVAQLDLNY